MMLFAECQAYFPLDCTVEDNSPYFRNVENFIYPNIKFDSLDAQKNWSAVFDGSAYIQVLCLLRSITKSSRFSACNNAWNASISY
jgi:hypothetical protein